MRLSDKEIHKSIEDGELVILGPLQKFPFNKVKQVQPCSIDLRLDNKFFKFKDDISEFDVRDLENVNDFITVFEFKEGEKITLQPHEILFGQIYEQLRIPATCSGMIEGRSRFARLGLSVHATGGFINPKFEGAMPLQIINNNHIPITIYPYINICQLILIKLTSEPLIPYPERSDNPYHKEKTATHSVIHKDPVLSSEYNLPNINTEIEERLLKNYLKEMELNRIAEKITKTEYRFENSNIGLLNIGEIKNLEKIESNINQLKDSGSDNIAKGIQSLAEQILKSVQLTKEVKEEVLEQLSEISEQANLLPEKRSKKSVIKAIFKSIGATLNSAGNLAEVWSTWGKDIASFFGIKM